MIKFIELIKNTVYLKSSNWRQLMAAGVFVGFLFSSLTAVGTSTVLAGEDMVNNGSAFLTVQPVSMDEKDGDNLFWQNNIFILVIKSFSETNVAKTAGVAEAVVASPGQVVIVTAYSSTPDQTDDSPFITANGTYVHDGVIAANFLPFGSKVRLPEYSGDKIYTVHDRMAKKNDHKIDIWMPSRDAALNFGVKKLAFEIVE